MEVTFDDADLAKLVQNARELQKKLGALRAKKIQQRLAQLVAAETLAIMRSGPGHCHELIGDRAGQLSLDLDQPYRLLFRPAGESAPGPGGGLDWSAVRAVVVIGVEDTHKK